MDFHSNMQHSKEKKRKSFKNKVFYFQDALIFTEWARNHAGGEEEGRGEIEGDGGGTQVSARDGEERAGAKGTGKKGT